MQHSKKKKKKKKKRRNEHNREESLFKDIELLEKNYMRENEEGLKTKQKELQELKKRKWREC